MQLIQCTVNSLVHQILLSRSCPRFLRIHIARRNKFHQSLRSHGTIYFLELTYGPWGKHGRLKADIAVKFLRTKRTVIPIRCGHVGMDPSFSCRPVNVLFIVSKIALVLIRSWARGFYNVLYIRNKKIKGNLPSFERFYFALARPPGFNSFTILMEPPFLIVLRI